MESSISFFTFKQLNYFLHAQISQRHPDTISVRLLKYIYYIYLFY